jgi:hypothetical protein
MKPCQKVKGANTKVLDDNAIDIICSQPFRDLANYVSLYRSGIYQLRFEQRQSSALVNVWNTFDVVEPPFALLCAGLEIAHPQVRIEDNSVNVRAKLHKPALNIDMYCDNKWQELRGVHPDLIKEDTSAF